MALLHNDISWTPQNLLGTIRETVHHLSYVLPKLIPRKSRILLDSFPILNHFGLDLSASSILKKWWLDSISWHGMSAVHQGARGLTGVSVCI